LEYIYRSLQDLEKKGEYVKVGLVGAGQMGSGLVSVAAQMPGFRIIAVADLEIERGIRAYQKSSGNQRSEDYFPHSFHRGSS
jgi:predicted homoserine dehydrogenase-like protein